MPVHETYANGVVVSSVAVPCSIADVKAEAQRRIVIMCGATSVEAALTKQLNATMRAIELTDAKQARALTAEEQAEETALRALADGIKAIRAASNIIEADLPVEVGIDPRWP